MHSVCELQLLKGHDLCGYLMSSALQCRRAEMINMHPAQENFELSPLGAGLSAAIIGSFGDLEAATARGVPAVAGIVRLIGSRFPDARTNYRARRFCGAKVAQVMRGHGYRLCHKRGPVPGDLFLTGAVWE